ncbi:MAG: right-handed parallel beta-helix repeat-containing protein, partial [Planctomycetes bacterium]|nr:right-handed parallel beta-helix repeat-containing protein [Planctomycetota bacterium]
YRGSIVHLEPATKYEIELSIEKINQKRLLEVETMSDEFKIAKRIDLPATQDGTYTITEGGSAETGYVLYAPAEGTEAKWDGKNETDAQLKIAASYVIVKGLTLTNSKIHGIQLMDVNNIVIDGCDISGWGQNDPRDGWGVNLQSAIYSKSKQLRTVIIQNCKLHHPRSDSNSWRETTYTGSKHPRGPQGISFLGGQGHYIVRYNKIYSDLDHMFNDSMGEVHNFSFGGFPNRDSDIYDNYVANCWDDGIEIEGANMNVRVWHNYINTTWGAVGAASPSLGPVYFWRNVYAESRAGITTDASGYRGHYLFKLGNENLQWVRGKMYIFHNTSLQPPAYAGHYAPCGAQSGIVFTSDKKLAENITSRNNLIHLRLNGALAIRDTQKTPSNDFDYDMHNGKVSAKEGSEAHAIVAEPTYERAPDGRLWLAPGTAGHDAAIRIPNFNDNFTGKAPDMGAIETGTTEQKPSTWPEFPEPAKAVDADKKPEPAPDAAAAPEPQQQAEPNAAPAVNQE